MEKTTFEKVSRSDKPLYGPRRLLLCGFASGAQARFAGRLETAGIADVARVWVDEKLAETVIRGLLELPDGTGSGTSSGLPRAVIVAGISEAQLVGLMTICRKSGMQQAFWAVLTPVSETWTVNRLLAELTREREALQKKKPKERG
jgi:hypothetical protein